MGGRLGRQWLAHALGLALLLQILIAPCRAEALSWRLPGAGAAPAPPFASDHAKRHLQEVPPPARVQQARLALEDRDPTVRILAPADGDLLPDGPWTLRLQVGDWPLVDGGPLGLGPHLVVQLDGEAPRPTVDTEVAMPPLSPGSHLLTVYAAKPWGEAHKSPLALRQIRIHRLAPNPATLPAPGTPQLIPVSPAGLAGDPPLLVDWLLIDAPLQGLRGDASGWRLRLTVNGESVLVDQQTPLWLQGWRPGSNALLLELLDGRGEPLNPPFNSLLREVIVPAAGSNGSARAQATPLTDLELAVLLGDQPVSVLTPASSEGQATDRPATPAIPTTTAVPALAPVTPPSADATAVPPASSPPAPPANPAAPSLAPPPKPQAPALDVRAPAAPAAELSAGSVGDATAATEFPAAKDPVAEAPVAEAPVAEPPPVGPSVPPSTNALSDSPSDALSASPDPAVSRDNAAASGEIALKAALASPQPAASAPRASSPAAPAAPEPEPPPPAAPAASAPAAADIRAAISAELSTDIPTELPKELPNELPTEGSTASSPEAVAALDPGMPARAEVNADGRLKRPSRPTPLERLRERFGR